MLGKQLIALGKHQLTYCVPENQRTLRKHSKNSSLAKNMIDMARPGEIRLPGICISIIVFILLGGFCFLISLPWGSDLTPRKRSHGFFKGVRAKDSLHI